MILQRVLIQHDGLALDSRFTLSDHRLVLFVVRSGRICDKAGRTAVRIP